MKKPDFRISMGTIKDILTIVLIIIIGWKLIATNISISFENIQTSDVLSIILAFFAYVGSYNLIFR